LLVTTNVSRTNSLIHLHIEEALIKALRLQFTESDAKAFESRYFLAKTILVDEILPWIRANEPYLSDGNPPIFNCR